MTDRKERRPRRCKKADPSKPPMWPQVGDLVDYHSIIGGPVTQAGMRVRAPLQILGDSWCVWLDGKAGAVWVEALTPAATVPS